MATNAGYDLDLNLEQRTFSFSMMAKGDYGNLRLHAFGDRFRFASEHPNLGPQAQIGIFLTTKLRWLSGNLMLNIEGGELDADEPTFNSSSMHCLWALRDRAHARCVIGQKLFQLGIVDSECRVVYDNFIGDFIFSAAKTSFETRCRGVVVVVEINQPRILHSTEQ